jgi:hypothetical protein
VKSREAAEIPALPAVEREEAEALRDVIGGQDIVVVLVLRVASFGPCPNDAPPPRSGEPYLGSAGTL